MYESLTPMERACLRLAHHDCKAEQVAHLLRIKTSTVNAHVFSARRKLGNIRRLTAADQLRAYEAASIRADTGLATASEKDLISCAAPSAPASQHPLSRQPLLIADAPIFADGIRHPADVRERRATFVIDDAVFEVPGGKEVSGDVVLRRIRLILVIALLAALVAIAAPAIYDSAAERIANSLERPHLR